MLHLLMAHPILERGWAVIRRGASAVRTGWVWFRSKYRGKPVRMTVLLLLLALSGYLLYLDITIREAFEGRKFALPARVYARALEVYPGLKLTPEDFVAELQAVGFREQPEPNEPATYKRTLKGIEFATREFVFWDGRQPAQRLRVEFDDGKVTLLQDRGVGDRDQPLLRIEPPVIGGIYPGHNEDRALLKLDQVPKTLVDALIAIEDRKYYSHWGIDPRGIARAVFKTVTGQRIEGGSTLTQQLVKNFFLTSERTITRKATEVLMALLLEMHYDKEEILETYINEIYFGQDANRAIHGFGLASHFYFDRPLNRLELHELATLVGMVKGPAEYNPRKRPDRVLQRRNIVLQEMARLNFITQAQFVEARQKPLGVVHRAPTGTSPYPAFLQLVHRQLRRDYHEDDLRSEGLRIFTTLDPRTQRQAEVALSTRLDQIEKARKIPAKTLDGAVVVTSTQHGEVLALVGGRETRFAGYNRALDAQRPIGSLAKPMVYLTALESKDRYTLVTPLDDTPLVWRTRGAADWEPKNYDRQFHGQVQLRISLANSYNVSTARLGIDIGIERILDKLVKFGIERRPPPYASSLLGAFELSPFEVTQLYQTFADNGFRTPLRAIREIVTAEGKPLQRYPLNVEPVAAPAPVYLLTAALQGVVREGTGQGLSHWLPAEVRAAGKTGTTDGLRDSWFAGYTGDRVAVVWVGRDDNQPSGLTGASGAMTIWGELMKGIKPEPLKPPMPENVELVKIDPLTGLRTAEDCDTAVELPFIKGSAPTGKATCATSSAVKQKTGGTPADKPAEKKKSWLQRVLE